MASIVIRRAPRPARLRWQRRKSRAVLTPAAANVTDNFNRADGALGTNWIASPSLTGATIVSNQVKAGAAWSIAYWNPSTNTFNNDQHSEITTIDLYCGAVVRHQSGVSSGYLAFVDAAVAVNLYRFDSGSFVFLANSAGGLAASAPGNVIRLEVAGSTLTGKFNGTSVVTFTDTTYATGQPGVAVYPNPNGIADDWVGGPIVVTGAQTLTPNLVAGDDAFFAPALSLSSFLLPVLATDADNFFAPVAAATATVLPALVSDADAFYVPIESSVLLPGLVADDTAFYSANITAAAIAEILSAGLFNDVDVFYAPNVANVLQFLRSALLADRDRFYAQQMTGGNIPAIPAGVLTGSIERRPILTGSIGRRSALTGSLRH